MTRAVRARDGEFGRRPRYRHCRSRLSGRIDAASSPRREAGGAAKNACKQTKSNANLNPATLFNGRSSYVYLFSTPSLRACHLLWLVLAPYLDRALREAKDDACFLFMRVRPSNTQPKTAAAASYLRRDWFQNLNPHVPKL